MVDYSDLIGYLAENLLTILIELILPFKVNSESGEL